LGVRVFFFVLDLFFSFASFGFVLAALFTTRSFVAAAALFSLPTPLFVFSPFCCVPAFKRPGVYMPISFLGSPTFLSPAFSAMAALGDYYFPEVPAGGCECCGPGGFELGRRFVFISFIRPPARFFFGRILEASSADPFAEVVPSRREHCRPMAFS
jgi:hypothetical protein